ncbi:MAG: hypothetical protein LBH40_03405, partial [Alphaproteobacteria bacterium]|nr:hypothetical protein [Alphaproteobacteria bacterium]
MPSFYTPTEEKVKQLEDLLISLKKKFAEVILDSSFLKNEVSITIKKENILKVFQELKDNPKFLF